VSLATLKEVLVRDDLTPALRGFALMTRGWIQRKKGRIKESLADLEEAHRLDPAEAGILRETGVTLGAAGRREEALASAQQAVALEPSWMNHGSLAGALHALGRHEEAIQHNKIACEKSQSQQSCAWYAKALHSLGETDRASQVAADAARLSESIAGLYDLACYHALAGRRAEAIRFLRRDLELGLASHWIGDDPDLVSLHGDPEFESIVAEVLRRVGKG
jgi:tetratricopeptide (TPR) repeat protein